MRGFRVAQMLILSACIIGLVCGCSVTPEQMEKCNAVCEDNDGLKYMIVNGGRIHAKCNNGAYFENIQREKAN